MANSKHYYFIDDNIWFQNKKQPPRKVKLFFVDINNDIVTGCDIDGNLYELNYKDLIIEEEINGNN